ncbi:MAG: hypothetical protein ACYDAL_15330 [Candidatus Dormibacteraceae bacterium]
MDWPDLRSWAKHWNDAALERLAATLPSRAPSRTWPLLGMLALGLVAGAAIGGYAVSQRSHMKRLSDYARRVGDEPAVSDSDDDNPVAVTTHRSNHRRKATSEV